MWELADYSPVNTTGAVGNSIFPEEVYGNVVGCGWMVFHKEVERPASYDPEGDAFGIDWDYDYDEDIETGRWVKMFACITETDEGYVVVYSVMAQDGTTSDSITYSNGPYERYQDAYEFCAEDLTKLSADETQELFDLVMSNLD